MTNPTGGSPRWSASADLVVVGTGVAGLTAALRAHSLGLRVVMVSKAAAGDGNTRWAQGGIAAVLPIARGVDDSVASHIEDTCVAGAGLCEEAAVSMIVREGPTAIARLQRQGAVFDVEPDGDLSRTREGGHSAFRVIHAGGDATGAEVERALLTTAQVSTVSILEHHSAVEVLRARDGRVAGLLVLDESGVAGVLGTSAVLIATGGVGQLYSVTTNPAVATGDGLSLALRAGALAADMEFVQFHPTALYTGPDARGRCSLVTEAVRGEGAILTDATGARVMDGEHPLADLAPRDVVSAAIVRRMQQQPGGVDDHVFLDATHLDGPVFQRRFPTVFAACAQIGVDPARDPIPIAPAAHFSCGGVVATVEGRTAVPGLYAAGEVARTGLHGANRLASNSLLEGLVVGERAAEAVATDLAMGLLSPLTTHVAADLPVAPVADRATLQRVMSRYLGIGRDAEGIGVAGSILELATADLPLNTRQRVEDAALTLAARALLMTAMARQESRGCHVRTDFPDRDESSFARSSYLRLRPNGEPMIVTAPGLVRSYR